MMVLLALPSCVAAQYKSSGGPSDMSVYAANRACAYILYEHPVPLSGGGLLGGLAAAADHQNSPDGIAESEEIDACMASHGWVKNP